MDASDGRPDPLGDDVAGRRAALHDLVARRLAVVGQRYTDARCVLVDVLATAGRPLTVAEAVAGQGAHGLSLSSTYRNLALLVDVGVARRVGGGGGSDRFELAEELAGHHHHLVCAGCGVVADIAASARVEEVLAEEARLVSAASGFEIVGHSIDLLGLCTTCRHR